MDLNVTKKKTEQQMVKKMAMMEPLDLQLKENRAHFNTVLTISGIGAQYNPYILIVELIP